MVTVSHMVNDVMTIQSTMKGREVKCRVTRIPRYFADKRSCGSFQWCVYLRGKWAWNFANVCLILHSLIYIVERENQEHTLRECCG